MTKRPAVLLEVLIGLSLTALLLTCLFRFFVESAHMEQKLEALRSAVEERAQIQTRVRTILSRSESLEVKAVGQESSKSLLFTFDNGIDPEAAFSGVVEGRLYLEDKALYLALWPLEKSAKWRKEKLLTDVRSFQFSFLEKSLQWVTEWSGKEPSALVRLDIEKEKETLHFAFLLPKEGLTPSYGAGSSQKAETQKLKTPPTLKARSKKTSKEKLA